MEGGGRTDGEKVKRMNVRKKGVREGRGDEWIKEEKREGWRKEEK